MMNTHADATRAMDRLAQGLRHMVDEADHLVKTAADSGDAKLEVARERLQEQLRVMRRQLEDIEDSLGRKIQHAARATDRRIHDHPYAAMGVVGVAGILAGLLLARR